MRRRFIILTLVGLLPAVSYFVVVNYSLLGRVTQPSVSEFVEMAKPWNSMVQAIYDYRAECGVFPKALDDLVPSYLPRIPDARDSAATISGNALMIHPRLPHTVLVYSFDADNEGWSARGDFGVGPLPLPKLASTRTVVKR